VVASILEHNSLRGRPNCAHISVSTDLCCGARVLHFRWQYVFCAWGVRYVGGYAVLMTTGCPGFWFASCRELCCEIWDLSRRWWCYSGFWSHVDWSVGASVSEKHTVFIFRAEASMLLRIVGICCPVYTAPKPRRKLSSIIKLIVSYCCNLF
jgi:hypothetical protein